MACRRFSSLTLGVMALLSVVNSCLSFVVTPPTSTLAAARRSKMVGPPVVSTSSSSYYSSLSSRCNLFSSDEEDNYDAFSSESFDPDEDINDQNYIREPRENEFESEKLTLIEPHTKKSIDCTVQSIVVVDGQEYIFADPIDTGINIYRVGKTKYGHSLNTDEAPASDPGREINYNAQDPLDVDTDPLVLELMPLIQEKTKTVLGPQFTLKDTPRVWTISGPFDGYDPRDRFAPDPILGQEDEDNQFNMEDFDSGDDVDVPPDENEGGGGGDDDDDQEEEVEEDDNGGGYDSDSPEVLFDIDYEGKTFRVVKAWDPYFLLAKKKEASGLILDVHGAAALGSAALAKPTHSKPAPATQYLLDLEETDRIVPPLQVMLVHYTIAAYENR